MRTRRWEMEDLERIFVNPFSTFTIVPELTKEHEPSMTTDEWIKENITLIQVLGAETWLTQVVQVLEGKAAQDRPLNPYHVINIDPQFAIEHEPIIRRDQWLEANTKLIPQIGIERWLRIFLEILEGDVPTAANLGFAPFPDAPFGYAPEGYQPRSRPSFPQSGKRRNKKRKRK